MSLPSRHEGATRRFRQGRDYALLHVGRPCLPCLRAIGGDDMHMKRGRFTLVCGIGVALLGVYWSVLGECGVADKLLAMFSGGQWFETPDYCGVPPSLQAAAHYFFGPAYFVTATSCEPPGGLGLRHRLSSNDLRTNEMKPRPTLRGADRDQRPSQLQFVGQRRLAPLLTHVVTAQPGPQRFMMNKKQITLIRR